MSAESALTDRARAFLAGRALTFDEANSLWKELKNTDEIFFARRVLERLRDGKGLIGKPAVDDKSKRALCQQEALLISKDCELSAAIRHDLALGVLTEVFGDLNNNALDGDAETLGIAGGILKRRWTDLGQVEDLRTAARFYERGSAGGLGDDAYVHINAAFLDDLLAHIGDKPVERTRRAAELRERIIRELPSVEQVAADRRWFNAATRAEALFGLKRYAEATRTVESVTQKPAPWELETTARQIATLAHIHAEHPLDVLEIRTFLDALLPGAADAARSVVIGKVGLALSGGGFRASFYHLGVLARLAELNVLRHVDVLSCVSGGSIVGACYWLALRRRLLKGGTLTRDDYIALVRDVIDQFLRAVATDLRRAVQPSKFQLARRLFDDQKGAMDPERVASTLDEIFYGPFMGTTAPVYMHDLPYTPADYNSAVTGSQTFHPGRHNWLRAHKVPVLVLNATTVNTGHAWQFTPAWMGESPWAVYDEADSVPRLEWSWYEPEAGWKMALGRAVAASACVPGIFAPLEIEGAYQDIKVQLVDGGVYDNQGTVSLLALNCSVLLVSDACGQLLLEKQPKPGLKGLLAYVNRSMSTLMERIRLANYADLASRKRIGLIRGLMFLHMKAGLDADTFSLRFSQESYELRRETLSPSGVRKDFQRALGELRTDLNAFTSDESSALMACGYQMAARTFERDLASLKELWDEPVSVDWPFNAMTQEITSTAAATPRRDLLLAAFREGSKAEFA
jgi:predicted acylesterase/phospholipase RssA